MKRMSGKVRKAQIKAARTVRRERQRRLNSMHATVLQSVVHLHRVVCDPAWLAPDGSYGAPEFVLRGYYEDLAFVCKDCGAAGVWTAAQQKWWFEAARGGVWTRAVRCRPCRARERARREIARRTHLEGLQKKRAETE